MDLSFVVSLFAITVQLSTPILLAALGEVFAERSGVLNLGVEGIMLVGAFAGFWGAHSTGNLWVGMLFGMFAGGLMGLLMAFMSVTLRADQVLSGLGIYLLGGGLSSYLYRLVFGVVTTPPRVEGFKAISIPLLSQVPVLGPILFQHNILVYTALVLVVASMIVLFRTTLGLSIRAVGEDPRVADTLGINVLLVRYACVVLGGVLGGLAGAYLSIGYLNIFQEGLTNGRGFIAIAIVYFGKWHPVRTLAGALLFGGSYALQFWLQALGVPVPYEFLLMLPFILTILVLVLVSREATQPASLAVPYEREA